MQNDIVFSKKWFAKHQTKLLWLLNTPVVKVWFRWVMGIRRFDCPLNETINQISTNNFSFGEKEVNGELQVKKDFRTHDKYSKRLYFAFKPFWYALHFFDWVMLDRVDQLAKLSFGFSTLTVYPDADPESTSCDGRAYLAVSTGAGDTWQNMVAGSGNGAATSATMGAIVNEVADNSTDKWKTLMRSFYLFDTSALTASATISAGVFSLYGYNPKGSDNLGVTPGYNVYSSNPASNTNLVASDYQTVGSTAFSDTAMTYASFTADQYNDTTLNASGRSAISKTGITKFSIRDQYDSSNTPPTWISLTQSMLYAYFADETGTTKDPKLVITYTLPLTKVCTEIVKTVPTQTKSTSRAIVSRIVQRHVVPAAITGKILSQFIKIVPTYSRVITSVRTLSDRIVPKTVYSRTIALLRTLIERIVPKSSVLKSLPAKTYSETVAVVPVYSKTIALLRTLTDSIVAIPVFVSAATLLKTLSESVVVQSVKETVLQASKTLIESIVFAANIIQDSGRTFVDQFTVADQEVGTVNIFNAMLTETVNAISSFANFVLSRIIVEPFTVAANFISTGSFYKVFIESVVGMDNYERILQAFKTITETVAMSWSRVSNTGRSLAEQVTVNSFYFRTRMKSLTQSFVVSHISITRNMARLFVETVSVAWQKLTHRSFSFVEQMIVVGSRGTTLMNKVLIERLTGATEWIFTKTQFVELTDVVNAASNLANQSIKLFRETVVAIGNYVFSLPKLFVEAFTVASSFLGAKAYWFSETVVAGGELGSWAIGKVFEEIARINLIFTEGRQQIMSEVIAVSDAITRDFVRLFTEIVSIATSLTRSIGRTIRNSVISASSLLFRHTFYKTLTDAVSVAGQAFNRAIHVFVEAFSVATEYAQAIVAKILYEVMQITSLYTGTWTLERAFSESVAVVSSLTHQIGRTLVEVVSVVDTFIVGAINKVLLEIVNVSDTIIKSLPRTLSEAFTVAGNGINQAVHEFVETVSVASTFLLGTISKLFVETVSMVSEFSKAWTLERLITETIAVGSNMLNQSIRVFSEAISVISELLPFSIGKMLIETVHVAQSIVRTISRTFVSVVSAVSSLVKSSTLGVFTEIVSIAGGLQPFAMARIFKETIVAGWAKIFLILNGIQVGLWKKVARITGSWTKRSRNEN